MPNGFESFFDRHQLELDAKPHLLFLGALFLAAIALVPIFVSDRLGVQSQFGGTSVLIVVGVLLDTIARIEQHRQLRQYDGFMRSGRVKFRGRQTRFM
ncbi:MAG: hypothetical protein IH921_09920 [Gemmatimonadetes bacterium]|nr:hypothetical protein [Gemmatimonadota bacterium]